jgi:hypothetical protein
VMNAAKYRIRHSPGRLTMLSIPKGALPSGLAGHTLGVATTEMKTIRAARPPMHGNDALDRTAKPPR